MSDKGGLYVWWLVSNWIGLSNKNWHIYYNTLWRYNFIYIYIKFVFCFIFWYREHNGQVRWNCLGLYSKYYLCWKQWPTYSLFYCPKLGMLILTYNYHHSHRMIIYLKFNFQYQYYTLAVPGTQFTATSWQPNTFTYKSICWYSYRLNSNIFLRYLFSNGVFCS